MDHTEFIKSFEDRPVTLQQQHAAELLVAKCVYPVTDITDLEQRAGQQQDNLTPAGLARLAFMLGRANFELITGLGRRKKVYDFYRALDVPRLESIQHATPKVGVAAAIAVLKPPKRPDSLQTS